MCSVWHLRPIGHLPTNANQKRFLRKVLGAKGHQGQIVIEAGTFIWLSSIYGDHLATNTYDTGFETDSHSVAIEIIDHHPEAYKRK